MSTLETFVSEDAAPAFAIATAIEGVLGDDSVLTVGEPRTGSGAIADLAPAGEVRAVAISIDDRPGACIALVVSAELAETIRVKGEASLVAASGALLLPAVGALALAGTALAAREVAEEVEVGDLDTGAPLVAFPVLKGTERVAMIVLRDADPSESVADVSEVTAAHEFQPLASDATPAPSTNRALELLNDVEMEVTAELGRKRIPVRDLLALTPGAVVELDRAAGSPVDVLVNGTVIARGEVVVIDEEFGIRIVEVLGREDSA